MPPISKINKVAAPLGWEDSLVGVFSGETDRVTLAQLRELFGAGTNIISVLTYPTANQGSQNYGKNGDLILCLDTNRLYRKAADVFPPVEQPTAILQGTKVDDTTISHETSWSSGKIDEYIRGAVAVALDLLPGAPRRVPFFSKVLLESLRVAQGPDSFTLRLVLLDGTVITSASGTGAACIGQVSVSINNLTLGQAATGYVVEFTNTGNAATTAQMRAIPLA